MDPRVTSSSARSKRRQQRNPKTITRRTFRSALTPLRRSLHKCTTTTAGTPSLMAMVALNRLAQVVPALSASGRPSTRSPVVPQPCPADIRLTQVETRQFKPFLTARITSSIVLTPGSQAKAQPTPLGQTMTNLFPRSSRIQTYRTNRLRREGSREHTTTLRAMASSTPTPTTTTPPTTTILAAALPR